MTSKGHVFSAFSLQHGFFSSFLKDHRLGASYKYSLVWWPLKVTRFDTSILKLKNVSTVSWYVTGWPLKVMYLQHFHYTMPSLEVIWRARDFGVSYRHLVVWWPLKVTDFGILVCGNSYYEYSFLHLDNGMPTEGHVFASFSLYHVFFRSPLKDHGFDLICNRMTSEGHVFATFSFFHKFFHSQLKDQGFVAS